MFVIRLKWVCSKNRSARSKICPRVTFPSTNLAWLRQESIPDKRAAPNRQTMTRPRRPEMHVHNVHTFRSYLAVSGPTPCFHCKGERLTQFLKLTAACWIMHCMSMFRQVVPAVPPGGTLSSDTGYSILGHPGYQSALFEIQRASRHIRFTWAHLTVMLRIRMNDQNPSKKKSSFPLLVRLPSFVRDFQNQCHSVPAVAVMLQVVREGDPSTDLTQHYEEYRHIEFSSLSQMSRF
jgi:hypothetical protein